MLYKLLEDPFFSPFGEILSNPTTRFDATARGEEDRAVIKVTIPGVPREDIEIYVNRGKLHVKRLDTGYERVWSIQRVDKKKIEATLENGILTIVLPYREEGAPESLKVEIK